MADEAPMGTDHPDDVLATLVAEGCPTCEHALSEDDAYFDGDADWAVYVSVRCTFCGELTTRDTSYYWRR